MTSNKKVADIVAELRETCAVRHITPKGLICECLRRESANELERLVSENERLRGFANDVMDEWWERWLDGADLQELGLKYGLIEKYDAPADNDCACEEPKPHKCYRYTESKS